MWMTASVWRTRCMATRSHYSQQPRGLAEAIPVSPDEVVQITKDLCNYIYTTYGRFPAQLDAMNMCMWLQAHHLETAYYDRFMQPGAYHEAIAHHMRTWHAEQGACK